MPYSGISGSSDSDEETKRQRRHKKSKKTKSHRKQNRKSSKKSKRRRSESSIESSSEEWVVKGCASTSLDAKDLPFSEVPELASDKSATNDWNDFESVIPTYCNQSKKEKRQTKKEWDAVRSSTKPGHHSRELNPFWKDGGDGLPPGQNSCPASDSIKVGDGGLYYLRKSYQRAKEQAKDEGRPLEQVAAERWGSLEKFHELLGKAESNSRRNLPETLDGRRSQSFKKPRRDSDGSSDETEASTVNIKLHGLVGAQKQYYPPKASSWRKPNASTSADVLLPSPTRAVRKPSPPIPELSNSAEGISVHAVEMPKVLTDEEMNALSAKILKAEMLGNSSLAADLKAKRIEAEAHRLQFMKHASTPGETKVVTKIVMDSRGRHSRNKPSETHRDGQRIRYFPDDDKQSLQSMFQREKMTTVEDGNALFSRLAGKAIKANPNDDYDLDDAFTDKASSSKKLEKEIEREVRRVIDDEKHQRKTLENCPWCFDGSKLEKNIVVSLGEKSFLCVPPFRSLTEGHCLLVPLLHASSATDLDEDVWNEIQKFRRAIVKMFLDRDQDVVIFESATFLQRYPHMYLECVPLPKETGDLAPIYFKKAIQECEGEWSQNKKLVDLRERDVRRAIPKGLPYFSVDFGNDSGFAHVIEDEKTFPRNFAHEIIGGMMELDHSIWRKRKHDGFKEQKEKLVSFLKMWAPYDWSRDG